MGALSETLQKLEEALESARKAKPNDKSDIDRYFAVVITDLEKVIAYYKVFIEFPG